MRADYLVSYDTGGRPHVAVTSLDAPFVVSAYLEYAEHNGWHFAYTREEQREIAELIGSARSLRRGLLFAWPEAVDPGREGGSPARHLDLMITGTTGWAVFHTGRREARRSLELLTVDERDAVSNAVRFGERVIYADRPFLPEARVRAAGIEFVRTGELPENVTWQHPTGVVPQGPFGRQVVAEESLPPRLDWKYPKRAQQWVVDPPPLPVS